MSQLYTPSRFPTTEDKKKDIGDVITEDVIFHHHSQEGHLPYQAINKANRLTDVVAAIARLLTPEQQDQLASDMGWFKIEDEPEEIVMNMAELMG